MSYYKHLKLDDRIIIEKGLDNHSSRKCISELLGKDKSTISKEIKKHCIHIKMCEFNVFCPNICSQLNSIPYVHKRKVGICNGCNQLQDCKLNKLFYSAQRAQGEYKDLVTE